MMYQPYRGRTITAGQLVFVYRTEGMNRFTAQPRWSIMAQTGPNYRLVLGHADAVSLDTVEFIGRNRAYRISQHVAVDFGVLGRYVPFGTLGCTQRVFPSGITVAVGEVSGMGIRAEFCDLDELGDVYVRNLVCD